MFLPSQASGTPQFTQPVETTTISKTYSWSGKGYCKDFDNNIDGNGYDRVSSSAAGCMERCVIKYPGTTAFYLKGTSSDGQCGLSFPHLPFCFHYTYSHSFILVALFSLYRLRQEHHVGSVRAQNNKWLQSKLCKVT